MSMTGTFRRTATVTAMVALSGLTAVGSAEAQGRGLPSLADQSVGQIGTGPSSSQSPYLLPSSPDVTITSVLTVGDPADNGYRMVGIPDGLGAYDNYDGTFTLLMNHELGADKGIPRAHGSAGAFVSSWVIDKATLRVISGSDLITTVKVWDPTSSSYVTGVGALATLSRLCSADLPSVSAFYNRSTGKGFDGRIFMNGEETGAEGRAFAHVATGPDAGVSYELPRLGKASFENQLANPATGDRTVVIGTDDTTPGQLYVYAGTKQSTGSPVERAGLTNGSLFGVKVEGGALESRTAPFVAGTPFSLHEFGDVSGMTGAALQTASVAAGVTEWLRPEDGSWDPRNPNRFVFATTDRFNTAATPARSRLWALTFTDVTRPELGGTVAALLDGTEGQQMLDNLTVSRNGKAIVQEDPGNQAYLAKVYRYTMRTDRLVEIAAHDPARFDPAVATPEMFLTKDEESSGVIDVSSILGEGSYLLTTQAHYAIPGELVEGGQLQVVRFDD